MPTLEQAEPSRPARTRSAADFSACSLFLVGDSHAWGDISNSAWRACVLRSDRDVLRGFAESPKDSVWVAHTASDLSALANALVHRSGDRRLLVLRSLREVAHQLLTTWFRYVVPAKDGISLLRSAELFAVLQSPNRDELLIGGAYHAKEKVLVLYRGSVEPLIVPFSWFKEAPGGARPDPTRFKIVDYGQTVKLGGYEAATGAILYEFDEAYRQKAKKRAVEKDKSLGGSIRRLRLQKGLSRADFSLPSRTLARIERGEVETPREETLRKIARRLDVSLESLGSY